MSDQERNTRPSGPVMIAATRIIKPPPTRVGKITQNVVLPRTIPLSTLVAGGAGVVVGVIVGGVIGSFQAVLISAIVCAFVAVLTVTWSPVKGETLFKYLGVQALNRARQRKIDYGGESVAVYIGVARLHRIALGRVHVSAGAVEVGPDTVDERGVLRAAHNKNLLPPRPLVADRPGFTPVFAQELPEEMLSQMGSQASASRRGAPSAQPPGNPAQVGAPGPHGGPGPMTGFVPDGAGPATGPPNPLDAPALAEPRQRRGAPGSSTGTTLPPRRAKRPRRG